MKKSDLRGFSDVFKFTFTQAIRQKSFFITMIVMIIIAIVVFPVMAIVNGGDKEEKKPYKTIHFYADEDFGTEGLGGAVYEKIIELNAYAEVKADRGALSDFDLDTEKKPEEASPDELWITAAYDEEGMGFTFYYSPESSEDEDRVSRFADEVEESVDKLKIENLNISETVFKQITREIVAGDISTEDYLDDDEVEIISESEYQIVYALLFAAYMIIVMSANMVATKIVEEKTNRIVEYLMTTVRPMALILGKVVSMLLVTVGELSLMLVGALIGKKIASSAFGYEVKGTFASILSTDVLKSLSVPNIIMCILIIGIGILLYGLIAGLFGATVSKMEELQQGLKTFQIILIVSFIAAVASSQFMWTLGINGFVKFTLLFPFTAVFVLPGSILIGKAGTGLIALSIAFMVIAAIAVLYFVSLVYESVIVMNGTPATLRQMINIAKGNKNAKKEVND